MFSKLFIIPFSVGMLVGSFMVYNYFKKPNDENDLVENKENQQLSNDQKSEELPISIINKCAVAPNQAIEMLKEVECDAIKNEERVPPHNDEAMDLEVPPQQELLNQGTIVLKEVAVVKISQEVTLNPNNQGEESKEVEEDVIGTNEISDDDKDTRAANEFSQESMVKLIQLSVAHLEIKSLNRNKVINRPNGLINYGNTCFANAVLQSLAICNPLVSCLNLVCGWEESVDYPAIQLINAFFKGYFKKSSAIIEPDMILPLIENYCIIESGFNIEEIDQQDSLGFLKFIISKLDEELIQLMGQLIKSAAIHPPSQEESKSSSSKSSELHIKETLVSPIGQLFYGSVRSHTIRENNIQTSSDAFSSIHLSIQDKAIKSVQDALDYHFMPEEIEFINSEDKSIEMAVKYSEFESIPNILVIQLKRFEFVSGSPVKITKKIQISKELELGVYEDKNDEKSKIVKKEYSLISVINHHGSRIEFGHYYNFSLFNNIWWYCNDRIILESCEQGVLYAKDEPYILLYQLK